NIVIVTATDECGNETTCEAIVTVNDENNPEFINCPEDIVVELEHGECFFLFDIPALIVLKDGEYISMADSSSEVEFISRGDVEIGDELEPGDYLFCYESIDLSGNSSTCSINITVISGGDPYIDCPSDRTVTLNPGNCYYFFYDDAPEVLGYCGPA